LPEGGKEEKAASTPQRSIKRKRWELPGREKEKKKKKQRVGGKRYLKARKAASFRPKGKDCLTGEAEDTGERRE